jgi:hypothetical protein
MWCTLPIYCSSSFPSFLTLGWPFSPSSLTRNVGGAYFRQPHNLYRLTVALIDLDTPGATATGRTAVVGPALLAAPAMLKGYHLGFTEVDNTMFDISEATGGEMRGVDVHEWAEKAVVNEDYHGVIIGTFDSFHVHSPLLSECSLQCQTRVVGVQEDVATDLLSRLPDVANSNATSVAVSAYETLASGTRTTMYAGSGALTMYYAEGRNFETGTSFPVSRMLLDGIDN